MFSNLLKKSTNWLKTNFFEIFAILLILLVTGFVAFKNYSPGTYLTGWDNLHPEFNFKLNIERSINAVWQEYQGVGLLGGMSHAADLPRQLILWGVSLFLPISIIRYFWTFLMLFVGPLGIYFLVKDKSGFGGLAASFFYLFNLATVQYFFVPFETFVSFYGFLPWLLYFALDYLKTGKNIWRYVLLSLIATSSFYVQTLFVVYGIFLFMISFKNLRRSIALFAATFLVNAFWLLPVLWFTLTSGSIPANSDINRIASPETIFMNQGRSNFTNIVNFKGYWFDYYDFGKDQKFDYLFKPWIDYSSKPYLKEIGIIIFALSIIGFLVSRQIAWLILLVICYVFLSAFKIPVSVLEEAFRNSFTKWSGAFSLVISVGLGYFVSRFKKFAAIPAIIIIIGAIYSVSPVFEGKLISDRVRINIPNTYFETFDWFNNESNGGRIGYFPAFDKWGWNYHNWGYGGSGFIWYGIENPILDRAFNVWSPINENYYNQVTKAILDNDQVSFKNVIEKYKVNYLFVDGSVVFPWGDRELLKTETIHKFANDLNYKQVYENNFVTVYDTGINGFTSVGEVPSFSKIDANLNYSKVDYVYQKYGNYVEYKNVFGLPFAGLDNRGDVDIYEQDGNLVFLNKSTGSKFINPITSKIKEDFSLSHGYKDAQNCELMKLGSVKRENLISGRKYTATNGGISCDYFVFDNLKTDAAYVLHISGENTAGRSLKVYLYNWESKRVELEELLPTGQFNEYYVVYPKKINKDLSNLNQGYTLNVETRSFGKIESSNIVNKIELLPFDINFVNSIYMGSVSSPISETGNLQIKSVKKFGTAIYVVETTGSGLLELGQGYSDAWVSYPKLDHLKLNSWSNSFKITSDGIYYLFFWPQTLEWLGFLLLLLTFIYMIVKSKK